MLGKILFACFAAVTYAAAGSTTAPTASGDSSAKDQANYDAFINNPATVKLRQALNSLQGAKYRATSLGDLSILPEARALFQDALPPVLLIAPKDHYFQRVGFEMVSNGFNKFKQLLPKANEELANDMWRTLEIQAFALLAPLSPSAALASLNQIPPGQFDLMSDALRVAAASLDYVVQTAPNTLKNAKDAAKLVNDFETADSNFLKLSAESEQMTAAYSETIVKEIEKAAANQPEAQLIAKKLRELKTQFDENPGPIREELTKEIEATKLLPWAAAAVAASAPSFDAAAEADKAARAQYADVLVPTSSKIRVVLGKIGLSQVAEEDSGSMTMILAGLALLAAAGGAWVFFKSPVASEGVKSGKQDKATEDLEKEEKVDNEEEDQNATEDQKGVEDPEATEDHEATEEARDLETE